MERFKIIARNELEKLPKTTGVYSFYTKKSAENGSPLIYIGKAINIQSRVKNHFSQPSYRDNLFIDKVEKIGYFETNNSEIEALILEANLIKKHQPKYNVVWKDGKNYFYVAIAKNAAGIPYVFVTHQPKKLQTTHYKLQTIYVGPFVEGTALKKTLRFLRRVFPYYTTKKHPKNKCTYCHLDLCPGPNPDVGDYKKNIKKLILILKGKRSAVLNALRKEMRCASKLQNFEKAGKLRDKIYNLQQVMSHTRVINEYNSTLVRNYAIAENMTTLQQFLGLKNPVSKIECYDVSNIQGKQATGSMVVFIDGKPNKNFYRKFKIKTENTPNDIAMLKEILERRFLHKKWKYPEVILIDGGKAQLNIAIKTKQSMTLLMRSSIQSHKMKNIKIMAIAKGRQELFIENKKDPIPLKQLPQEIYNLIKRLDDEAHRFAISYHKVLRKKNLLQ